MQETKDNLQQAEEECEKAKHRVTDDKEWTWHNDEDGENELDNEEFVEWLEKTNPALYKLTTVKYHWDPPPGTLEGAYDEFAAIRIHADALRQVVAAFEAREDMQKWKEWTMDHMSFFHEKPRSLWPDDIWDAYNGGVLGQKVRAKPTAPSTRWRREGSRERSPRRTERNSGETTEVEGDEEQTESGQNDYHGWKRITGPYLTGGLNDKYKILRLKKEYELGPDAEILRENFERHTGKNTPKAGMLTGGRPRTKYHLQYLQAIAEYEQEWDRFPSLEDYLEAVEKGTWVEVEDDSDDE